MGLMTGLAIGGLTAALAAQKLKSKKPGAALNGRLRDAAEKALVAPGPTGMDDTPTAPILDPAATNAAAVLAGEKQRKRARLGGLSMRPIALKQPGVKAVTTPMSLYGSN